MSEITYTSNTFAESEISAWSRKAHAALEGAEVLADLLAEKEVHMVDLDAGPLTRVDMDAIKASFLENNEYVQAIRDCLIEWPES